MPFPGVNTITLAGKVLPGQWVLQPGASEFVFQEQQGIGLSGATLRVIGDKLAHCVFTAFFWKDSDWDLFQPIRKQYLTKAVYQQGTAGTYSIGIVHPELNFLGITAVALAKTPWFTRTPQGKWYGSVEFIQYRKPKPALESPDAAIPAAATPAPVAQDAYEQELALHEQQQLAARGP